MNEIWTQYTLVKQVRIFKNNQSLSILLEQYDNLIKTYIRIIQNKYPAIPFTYDEVKGLCMGCFYLIIINYDGKHKKSLPAYIKEFMFYSIQNELRHFVTKANMVMNYADLYLDKYDKVVFENNPLINIVKTLSLVNGKLNYQEQKIFSLLVEEKTPKQISEMLSIPLQTVYQRKAKIFNKATTIISMYD